ncbi:copper transporter [Haloechinothrix sp. LS1_15]|uniref:copper transporter n=1 Tax=Haloechinothrix sp. LS1_15 TaxID=2652248 RepID=UPI0029462898|nr:copper transporter [Haloechinothrix sp. LS1_15]MDV6013434.1 copper transporter [Haloechinothrix sp. LS1_15]
MISLRYHIVSLAAAFLALAVGVVLGSSTLSGSLLSGLADNRDELAERVTELEAERSTLQARLAEADGFAASVGPRVVADRLDERSVVLFTTEDADSRHRDALVELIESSGAEVTGEVGLTGAFADPSKADRLVEIATRLQPSGAELPTSGGPGSLAGALLGQTLLLDADSAEEQSSSDERTAALTGLEEGGFVETSGDVEPAQLAVVLTGGDVDDGRAGDRAATVARFAAQLDRAGAGTVLAGSEGSATGSGAIGVARADSTITDMLSTVDHVDTAAGRVVTVLALRRQLDGEAEQYGVAANADRPAPGVDATGS